ncbi:hypothetical protein AMS68_001460 [Peltaster fructicola]|uniref:MRH domain-containing protein n=1 Tax=Peltaster fructicola TaxID=286661 RepID=A0A6H0XMJ8_9PEZI|nr:hypothetical protein AMS68_001460 [Peltaster fructicola]
MNLILYYSLALYLSSHGVSADPIAAAPEPSSTPVLSCTIRSPASGSFFDLNKLHILTPGSLPPKSIAKPRSYSWNATGYDYGYNFTMNFCGPVVEELEDVVDVDKSLWRNVSAYYKQDGKIYSIGQQNDRPVLRGRKLVLNYTGGSYCGHGNSKRAVKLTADDKDDKEDNRRQRKSTIISLLCDRDTTGPLLGLNFVGATEDECGYFFEARSIAACGGIEVAKQTVGPGGVFGIIVLIAVLVYLVGGCVYSRTVLQQRGWRQCPNYGLWASAFSFLGDLFIILTSSCSRCLPSRKGYSRVTSNGLNRGRGRDSDAENRLIDELNEEWDD